MPGNTANWGYCGPGTTPQTGTVNVSGTSVTWASGSKFDTSWPSGSMIYIVGGGCTAPWNNSIPGTYCTLASSPSSDTSLTLGNNTATLTGATYYTGSIWDANTREDGSPCLDQPGRGQGDLLEGYFPDKINQTTGTAYWPNQALEPIYFFMNTASVVPGWGGSYYSNNTGGRVVADRDYYQQASGVQTSKGVPFDGTTGVGWGTWANRPANCVTGRGYFVTDQGSWNKSLSNQYGTQMNGASGVLYTCTNGGAEPWTMYYTPYQYPHPLQRLTDIIPPAAPTGVTVN
jgi:hypothetical protein